MRVSTSVAVSSVLFAVVASLGGCESTVDLGGNVDAGTADRTADTATAPTCDGLCRKLRGCGFLEDADSVGRCIDDCNERATEGDLTCVARESCATILSVCAAQPTFDGGGDGATPISQFDVTLCKNGCSSAHNWDCIDAADFTACQLLCESSSKRRIYADCASGSGTNCTKHRDCWNVFKTAP